jgi:hypothetical protein
MTYEYRDCSSVRHDPDAERRALVHGESHRLGYDPLYEPFWGEPRYYTYYDANDVTYWDWNGETGVRIHLAYQRGGAGGKAFAHEFGFRRKKV